MDNLACVASGAPEDLLWRIPVRNLTQKPTGRLRAACGLEQGSREDKHPPEQRTGKFGTNFPGRKQEGVWDAPLRLRALESIWALQAQMRPVQLGLARCNRSGRHRRPLRTARPHSLGADFSPRRAPPASQGNQRLPSGRTPPRERPGLNQRLRAGRVRRNSILRQQRGSRDGTFLRRGTRPPPKECRSLLRCDVRRNSALEGAQRKVGIAGLSAPYGRTRARNTLFTMCGAQPF